MKRAALKRRILAIICLGMDVGKPRDGLYGMWPSLTSEVPIQGFVQVLIQALITQNPADKLLLRRSKGMHLAEATMWLACSSLLASFDIRPPEEDGRSVLPVPHFMDGSVRCVTLLPSWRTPYSAYFVSCVSSHPEHFECTIRPRVSMDRLGGSVLE